MKSEKQSVCERIGEKRFAPGKGVTEPPPENGWRRFFFVLGTHFWKLIQLNLLFLAFSIPIITIPASLCGINRALLILYREGNCFIWTEFIKEFRANLWKAIPFALIGGVGLFASYYFLSLSLSASANRIGLFPAATGLLILIFIVLFLNYVFVFLPTLDLKSGQIARNAFIFAVTEWKTNLIILASVAATVLFSVALYPYSLLTLVFLSFALMQYIVCAVVNQPLQKRIIGPYLEGQTTPKA